MADNQAYPVVTLPVFANAYEQVILTVPFSEADVHNWHYKSKKQTKN